jgi:membrane-associated protein
MSILPSWLSPASLIDSMGSWAILGVALIIFAECGILLGFFLPGDTLLFVSGLLIATARDGGDGLHIDIALFIVLISAAAFVGNLVGYYIGRAVGPKVFSRKDAKLLKPEHVERSHAFFERYGPLTVMIARFVPVVRTVATVMAGVGRMNPRLYTIYSAIGGVVWVTVVTLAGFFLGQIGWIRGNVDLIFVAAAVVVVLAAAAPAFLHWRQRRRPAAGRDGSGAASSGSGLSGSAAAGSGAAGSARTGSAPDSGASGPAGSGPAAPDPMS